MPATFSKASRTLPLFCSWITCRVTTLTLWGVLISDDGSRPTPGCDAW
jgi:hypothetical protein